MYIGLHIYYMYINYTYITAAGALSQDFIQRTLINQYSFIDGLIVFLLTFAISCSSMCLVICLMAAALKPASE